MDDKDKIEKIMQVENLNSAQFATEIGIQGSTLSHILNGRNKPSLDVLKKIMNRFCTINLEWLILDSGTMYRQEKHSQTPTLFDSIEESQLKSEDYSTKNSLKNETAFDVNQKKIDVLAAPAQILPSVAPVQDLNLKLEPPRSVKRIIIYYTDNTFEELSSNRQ